MYTDGGGTLADKIREELPARVSEFFNGKPSMDAYRLSSCLGWAINDRFYKMDMNTKDFIRARLQSVLAHASKSECKDIDGRETVLCIRKNKSGRTVYAEHLAGCCPYVLATIEEFKRLQGSNK